MLAFGTSLNKKRCDDDGDNKGIDGFENVDLFAVETFGVYS